jgi:hypothetical protein
MNPTSPVSTGAVAITGAMLGGCIVWLCQACKLPPPPSEVAGTLGAIILVGAHQLRNVIAARIAAQTTPLPSADPRVQT